MNVKWKNWLLLIPATLLFGVSLWVLSAEYVCEWRSLPLNESWYVIHQAVFGILALILAVAVGRCSLHRPILKWRFILFLPLLAVFIAIPFSIWMDTTRIVYGAAWWQRSVGVIAVHLAFLGGLCTVLPRFPESHSSGLWGMVGLLLYLLIIPLFFLNRLAEYCVLSGILLFVLPAVLRGRHLAFSLIAALLIPFAFLFAILLNNPNRMTRIMAFLDPEKYSQDQAWQLLQSLTSVYVGGWTGCSDVSPMIPEWHTGFIFGRLCSLGGAVSAMAVCLIAAALIVLSWRVVWRQRGLPERTLAAGCASILTLYPLGHLCVCLGLLPTMEYLFPFLSYGRYFLLFCGVLLGLLISLDRNVPEESDGQKAGRSAMIMPCLAGLLLILIVIRLVGLVVNPPSSVQYMRQSQFDRAEARQKEAQRWVRGRILDCNGRVLARNSTNYILCADPSLLAVSSETNSISEVARLAGLDEPYIRKRIADPSRRYVRLRKYLPAERVEDIRRMHISGFFLDKEPSRDYPFKTPLAQLVGIVHLDESGLIGAGGIEMVHHGVLDEGQDVTLTLDIELQTAVQQIAEAAAEETQAKQVQIIVMNPQTGAIRAAAQVPAVDGSRPIEAGMFALNWRAVMDLFEPGGLIKPLVMASALDLGAIQTNSLINCENGHWFYAGSPLHDAQASAELSPEEILLKSSNIGMAKIGLEMGEQPLYDALVKWRLPEKCSVGGFGGAADGLLYPTNRWSKITVTRITMGHECAFSLMQIVRAYTAFFNDGKIVEPHIIAPEVAPELTPVIRPETTRWVRDALKKVVTDGSAQKAQIAGFPMFGKTAVVQKVLPEGGGYSQDKFQTSFIGGCEIDGTPWLIAVWLDEPSRKESFNPALETFRNVSEEMLENK